MIWTLILVLLAGSMKNSLLLNFYFLNNDGFTEFFCENKDRPDSECNGHCQLSKMADDEDKGEIPGIFQQLRVELVYYVDGFIFEFPEIMDSPQHHYYYLNSYRSAVLEQQTPPPLFG